MKKATQVRKLKKEIKEALTKEGQEKLRSAIQMGAVSTYWPTSSDASHYWDWVEAGPHSPEEEFNREYPEANPDHLKIDRTQISYWDSLTSPWQKKKVLPSRFLKHLSHQQRTALEHISYGYSHGDAANLMGISKGAFSNYCSRAKQILRRDVLRFMPKKPIK